MSNNPPVQDKSPPANYYEDEISLIDLWLVLVRRRAVLMVVVIASLAAGLLYAFSTQRMYQYSTSIEIGTRVNDSALAMIESPQALLAKIEETYIPLVRQNLFAAETGQKSVPALKARIPKGGEIIVINSQGTEEKMATHVSLQQAVMEQVSKDHSRMINVIRKELETLRQQALTKLAEIKDNATLIAAREKRREGLEILLQKQATEARADLQQALAARRPAVKEVTGASHAMTLLILDSEIQQHRKRLSEIDERLQIEMGEMQDNLVKELADNQRAQVNQQNLIDNLGTQLVNLRETRALTPPMRSLEAVGQERKTVVILSLVLGVMLGVFTAFFSEFISKARTQSHQASES